MNDIEIGISKYKRFENLHGFYLVFILNILAVYPVHGQDNILSGVVAGMDGRKGLEGAHVVLTDPTDSLKMATVTRQNGQFGFRSLKQKNYQIKISHVGFESQEKSIEVKRGVNLLDIIFLLDSKTVLKEVKIEGEVPPTEIRA